MLLVWAQLLSGGLVGILVCVGGPLSIGDLLGAGPLWELMGQREGGGIGECLLHW